ncbi:MAG: DUF4129 domain-containing protein [Verrucomicrobiales bacterium]|nr:DUF4129 domain-containing protein [Verrucomicrobiales bacterium]
MPHPRRHPLRKSLGDYFAIALAPALVVVLVGSLVFFLAEALYHGQQGGRLRWTLGWFTLASVLITRIAVELGSARGFLYGFALAGVTSLALIRYVDPPFAGILLLALAWFCVDRLVRDSTLIDEDEDATGEGLLDSSGLGAGRNRETGNPVKGRLLYFAFATREAQRQQPALPSGSAPAEARRPARPPGVWVIGFSLAALPLFGFGQAALPAADLDRREVAFTCLWFYLLAAFGLLLTTSFLGLRRYLRQRHVQMPPSIAASWLQRGTLTAVAILLLAFLLPRPDAAYSLPMLAEQLGTQSGTKASRSGRGTPATEPKSQGTQGDTAPDSSGSGSRTSSTKAPPPSSVSNPPTPTPSSGPADLGRLLKWFTYLLLGTGILLVLWRHGSVLWEAIRELWRDLLSLGRRQAGARSGKPSRGNNPIPKPFAHYRNPFSDPRLSRLPAPEIVAYSFEALQAWCAGCGLPRQDEETPIEFSDRVVQSLPEFTHPIQTTVQTYSRYAYGSRPPTSDELNSVRQLWALMTAHSMTSRI